MTRTFFPLYFDTRSNWYYIRVRGGNATEQEKQAIKFTAKDNELLAWLEANVGPSHTETAEVPIKGEGWEIVAGVNYSSSSGVFIDDELLAVQLKCSGVLDDRPEDPILKMIKDMQIHMQHMKVAPISSRPWFTMDSLSQIAPVSEEVKLDTEHSDIFFPKSK